MKAFPWFLLLAPVLAVLVYLPSLRSEFVYDARAQVLVDTYIHDRAHFADVLTLRVLRTEPMAGSRPASRPGQLLLLMIEAAIWGKEPFGYHLTSLLLHAANVALLGLLMWRLVPAGEERRMGLWAAMVAAALFAVHPFTVEAVAEVGYSADLLVTFFTLGALVLATWFVPRLSGAMLALAVGIVFCCFAAVASKESGLAACLLVAIYVGLFRRGDSWLGWGGLFIAGAVVTGTFLWARFALSWVNPHPPSYIGGSLGMVFEIQPRLWVFMMEKIVWPFGFSADYQPSNVALSAGGAVTVLFFILALQAALAWWSRSGALGVMIFWLGLATVSNFFPLYRPLADRFYYLPLTGVALQIFAGLLLLGRWRGAFFAGLAVLGLALVPLAVLNRERQAVFADSLSLWRETLRVSPDSFTAANDLGCALYDAGDYGSAVLAFQRSIELTQNKVADPWLGLGLALEAQGKKEAAVAAVRRAVAIDPSYASPAELRREIVLEPQNVAPLYGILRRAGITGP